MTERQALLPSKPRSESKSIRTTAAEASRQAAAASKPLASPRLVSSAKVDLHVGATGDVLPLLIAVNVELVNGVVAAPSELEIAMAIREDLVGHAAPLDRR